MDHNGQNRDESIKESEYITVREFAKILKISTKTVSRSIKKGKIHAINVGPASKKLYRIPKSEINRIALFDLQDLIDKMVEQKMSEQRK
jgi:excisionase family DNA binding protein